MFSFELTKTQKRALMVLASLTIVITLISGLGVTTAREPTPDLITAAQISYRGTLDTWYHMNGVQNNSAKILSSKWLMGFTNGGRAAFYASYLELNVYEEIPGTYDDFVVFMIADQWEPLNDGYILEGTSYWWKNGVLTYEFSTTITVDPEFYETQLRADFDAPENFQFFGSLTP